MSGRAVVVPVGERLAGVRRGVPRAAVCTVDGAIDVVTKLADLAADRWCGRRGICC